MATESAFQYMDFVPRRTVHTCSVPRRAVHYVPVTERILVELQRKNEGGHRIESGKTLRA